MQHYILIQHQFQNQVFDTKATVIRQRTMLIDIVESTDIPFDALATKLHSAVDELIKALINEKHGL